MTLKKYDQKYCKSGSNNECEKAVNKSSEQKETPLISF